ncbi:NAD(P)/FAD-dependent oxidoreductase [bacterium]|nr:NAD(P)/FAD-dependent oxidoreductase [bacterium]
MTDPSVVIVGGGPAGIAAAIQLQRYGLHPVLYEANELGGLLRNANLVENYPGFPGGITGRELVGLFRRQVEQFAVDVRNERVLNFDVQRQGFTLAVATTTHQADIVLLATGTNPIRLPDGMVPEDCINLIHCEVVALRELRDRRVAIIGAGDAAFDYALQLANKNDVVIYNRSARIRAMSPLISRVQMHPHINYELDHELISLQRVNEDELELTLTGPDGEVVGVFDRLICALGRSPNLDCIPESVVEDNPDLRGIENLYILGDLANNLYRQTSIAVGDGVRTAMRIWDRLELK